ncbi:stage II sporulation protein R [Thermoanaerobacter kivui]|uniref:Stage II sporulation protein R n=1 Tax=Thermoanaerobacter kivui TaxID=2325 RepID=A0A097AUA7_THEKI|nr:stage II sporulation protein R [Thermoanaerobacter kivui]AIS53412.1 stage II sporulation protein R [Thermoanaerobacter kivui]
MKKIIAFIVVVAVISGYFNTPKTSALQKEDLSRKLIRFHVIANSDSQQDQQLKLKVRDAILFNLNPKFEKAKSVKESEKIIKENLDEIKKIAQEEILNDGKNYDVKVMYGKYDFPTRYYGAITLPAGSYNALKVVIGNGEGKNWWCVMFPPLCFIDITHGITDSKAKEEMAKYLTKDEMEIIESDKTEIKFKIAEILEKYYNKLKMAWNK